MVRSAGSRIMILKIRHFNPTDADEMYKLYKRLFF